MKKWNFILSLILAVTMLLSLGCITVLAATDTPGTIGSMGSASASNSSGLSGPVWNTPTGSSSSGFVPAPNNPGRDDDSDDDEDEVCYTIIATAHKGGSISPKGVVEVWEHSDQEFTMKPKKNYAIEKVLVDGKHKGALDYYEFEDVTRDHTIEVYFITTAEAETGKTETSKTDTEFNPNTGAC